MQLELNTVRMVDYDQLREFASGDDNSMKNHLALGLLNSEDYKSLKLSHESKLKVISKYGSVIIKAEQLKDVPKGMIILPVSIWANQLTGVENDELCLKNISVKVELTNEPILDIEDLLKAIKEN